MIVKQTRLFGKQKKKLHANQIQELDKVIKKITLELEIDEPKQGDLSAIRVFKFKMFTQEVLLAYQHANGSIILHAIGTHENFYRDLKRSL